MLRKLTSRSDTPALPRVFWALWSCQLVNRLGDFVLPFLVLYLTEERHLSPSTAGAVAAAVGVGHVVSQFLGGWLSDRIGRRHTMLMGLVGTAITLVALGAASTLVAIGLAAFAVGVTSDLVRPAVSATVADLLAPQERARAYGLLFWAINLGFSFSTVSAGVLASYGFGLLFWANATASLMAALIIWQMVPETRPVVDDVRRPLLSIAFRDATLLCVIGINIVYAAIYFQAYSTLPLVMADDGLGSSSYGVVIALNGIIIVLLQPFVSRRVGALDRSVVLAVSMLLVGLGFGLGAVVHSIWGYGASIAVWTVGEIGFATVGSVIIADLAPVDLRGGYMGLAWTAWGFGSILGPLVGTWVLDEMGRSAVWVGCVMLGGALFAAQLALAPRLRRAAEEAAAEATALSPAEF